MSILSQKHFHQEEAAIRRLEEIVWPNGPVCPKCGNIDGKRIYSIKGKSARPGLRCCGECRKQFTVKVGTVFESSHIPLHKWWQAAHLLASSKKGFSAHQLHRVLEVTYKTAWFMAHRLREAMRAGELAPFGIDGGTVEIDETFIGIDPAAPKDRKGRGYAHKNKVLSLVDRDTKQVRSMVVDNLTAATLTPILEANIAKEARVMTDEAPYYRGLGKTFADHGHTNHKAGQYVDRNDPTIHTNTVEGCFSVFKRGMKGVYQHCGKQHLHRYLAEFDFRYNNRSKVGVNDPDRTDRALKGIAGKRLTYRRLDAYQVGAPM